MREISTEPIKIGELILVDGEKYVAEEAIGKMCSLCAFHNSYKCENIPCNGVIFKRVNKESHGRCIDADILCKRLLEAVHTSDDEWLEKYKSFIFDVVTSIIEDCPTVLEASK